MKRIGEIHDEIRKLYKASNTDKNVIYGLCMTVFDLAERLDARMSPDEIVNIRKLNNIMLESMILLEQRGIKKGSRSPKDTPIPGAVL